MKTIYVCSCPHCGKAVESSFTVRLAKAVQKPLERFPISWKKYAGKSFYEVIAIDPEYIVDVWKDENVVGPLREGINAFMEIVSESNLNNVITNGEY